MAVVNRLDDISHQAKMELVSFLQPFFIFKPKAGGGAGAPTGWEDVGSDTDTTDWDPVVAWFGIGMPAGEHDVVSPDQFNWDWTGATFHEDGSGLFSFDPASDATIVSANIPGPGPSSPAFVVTVGVFAYSNVVFDAATTQKFLLLPDGFWQADPAATGGRDQNTVSQARPVASTSGTITGTNFSSLTAGHAVGTSNPSFALTVINNTGATYDIHNLRMWGQLIASGTVY
jgi:hypothetical protein